MCRAYAGSLVGQQTAHLRPWGLGQETLQSHHTTCLLIFIRIHEDILWSHWIQYNTTTKQLKPSIQPYAYRVHMY